MKVILEKTMPQGSSLLLAEISQDFDAMKKELEPKLYADLETFKSELRKQQVLFTRIYLKNLNLLSSFFYSEDGKPQLKEGYISISHCKNKIVIYIDSTKKTGIDIEHYSEKIKRVAARFMNDQERERFPEAGLDVLTLIWSTKEAVFKKYGNDTTYFSKNQEVLSIDEKLNKICVNVTNNGISVVEELTYQKFEDFVLVYST